MTEIVSPNVLGAATSRAFPLGLSAPLNGDPETVVNVAVWAPELAELILYFQPPGEAWQAMRLPEFSDGVHHGVVHTLPIGSRYGFATEDIDPEAAQLLLDPYARSIDQQDGRLLGVRMFSGFDWSGDAAPHIPWRDSVIYEAHLKGLTQLHPEVPEEIRGSYAGLAHPAVIRHLTELGVTAVELLPIHAHLDEQHLRDCGLPNYWGYNTIGYFAPHAGYASAAAQQAGPQAVQDELKGMIKLLHAAGIEVILDVVYNHTAEGRRYEPALSWRGLAEKRYYRFHDDHYLDTTGCGNTLDFSEPKVIQLALDSLRYWVEEFHVDGFRFDLAVTLGRDAVNNFSPQHPFVVAATTDRVLSGVKLISEPWDVGHDGWQTGRFPVGWADWNDHFRDSVRDFWLSDQASVSAGGSGGGLARLADALSGSSRLFAASGRSQLASINLVTAHDGFTLADLVSYNGKHNEANREENRDGSDNNRSWNHGVEGATQDPAILSARAQTARNLMATLLLSLGVPMITAGDELGKTQAGNNNAYCQDNEISWIDWSAIDETMLGTTRRILKLRKEYLSAQPSTYPARDETSYLHWFDASGRPLSPDQWQDGSQRVLQMLLGSPGGVMDGLVVFNATAGEAEITFPCLEEDRLFEYRFGTSESYPKGQGATFRPGGAAQLAANTITIYRA
ncbi:glycogen debranching protein GlgX [Psychromicrobium sp. YIM B11713]|uniref:glycogen debranching protein GlgX n=1 Tax=Psychromicrobium sp. YIM B11713 TaxID=3145233 RepID=UPI00374E2520